MIRNVGVRNELRLCRAKFHIKSRLNAIKGVEEWRAASVLHDGEEEWRWRQRCVYQPLFDEEVWRWRQRCDNQPLSYDEEKWRWRQRCDKNPLNLMRRKSGGEDRDVTKSIQFVEEEEWRWRQTCELTAIQLRRGGIRGERLDPTVPQLVLTFLQLRVSGGGRMSIENEIQELVDADDW